MVEVLLFVSVALKHCIIIGDSYHACEWKSRFRFS